MSAYDHLTDDQVQDTRDSRLREIRNSSAGVRGTLHVNPTLAEALSLLAEQIDRLNAAFLRMCQTVTDAAQAAHRSGGSGDRTQ